MDILDLRFSSTEKLPEFGELLPGFRCRMIALTIWMQENCVIRWQIKSLKCFPTADILKSRKNFRRLYVYR